MVTGGQWYGMGTGVNGMEWLPGVTVYNSYWRSMVWNGYRGSLYGMHTGGQNVMECVSLKIRVNDKIYF